MAFATRLDRMQQQHPVLGLPIAVLYKYLDDQGAYLAALITYYAFIAIFPLLLLLSSILGFVVQDNPQLRDLILESALRQIPIIGDQVSLKTLEGSVIAVGIGFVGALYGAMGVAQALQHAMNFAWNIPRNSRPNPILLRLKSLLLLSLLAVFLLITTALSQLGPALEAFGLESSSGWGTLGMITALPVSVALFFGYSRIGTAVKVGVRTLLPGAVLSAVLWQVLQTGGGRFVRVVGRVSATYGVFGVVLGLIAWLYLAAVVFVVCVELNVVVARRLYPRSLLTLVTDDVDLTSADRRAYTAMVAAQRLKGFQRVTVEFDHEGQNATARRRADDEGPPSESESP